MAPENHKYIRQYVEIMNPENLKFKNVDEVKVDYK